MKEKIILSGMRPTGILHLGHWVGALSNWIKLQKEYKCFFMVADWHALMSEYKNPSAIKNFIVDNVSDWISWGIDPEENVIFVQSEVREHLDLFMIFSALAPLGWLYRCPTFKEQINQLKDKEINTYGFLGYPLLQASDIALYKADFVPVGEDQLPHLELAREILRRFHFIYKKEVFIEPQPLLTKASRLLGLDGRKMSKSYNNYIALSEEDKDIERKVMTMFTDPARKRKNDPGHPDVCNLFSYYSIFKQEKTAKLREECINAERGCSACKSELAEILKEIIAPKREKKKEILEDRDFIRNILEEGAMKARKAAAKTLAEAKEAAEL